MNLYTDKTPSHQGYSLLHEFFFSCSWLTVWRYAKPPKTGFLNNWRTGQSTGSAEKSCLVKLFPCPFHHHHHHHHHLGVGGGGSHWSLMQVWKRKKTSDRNFEKIHFSKQDIILDRYIMAFEFHLKGKLHPETCLYWNICRVFSNSGVNFYLLINSYNRIQRNL